MIRVVVGLAVISVLTSCGGAHDAPAPAELIAFDTYMAPADAFEATRLVKLDPATLRPLAGPALKLGDAAAGGVLGPDGRTYAVGGVNYGEVILVDLLHLRQIARIDVQRPRGGEDIEVDVVSWPRPHLLLAVVGPAPGKYLVPQRLAIIDPILHRVLRTTALPGTALGWVRGNQGRAAILTASRLGRLAPARLVVVGPTGDIRRVTVSRITAGATTDRFVGIDRFRGLTSDGRHAFLADSKLIASVDLDTLGVSYHPMPKLVALPPTPPYRPGSSGLYRSADRRAQWLGDDKILVTGMDAAPTHRGYLERTTEREAAIVDTHSWRLVRAFRGATGVQAAFGLWFGGLRGASLVAFRKNGSVLYRKRHPNLWWTIIGGRLIAGNPDGSWLAELDPQTGHLLRVLGRSAVWPLDVLVWRPPRGR